MRVILASKSARRRELLPKTGIGDFTIIEAGVDEPAIVAGLHEPREIVLRLAAAKARAVAAVNGGSAVIGADTVVAAGGEILGKPRDHADAVRMLRLLSGREHEVYTGVAVIADGCEYTDVERTAVRFRELSDSEIENYIAAEPPYDKAGAYAIQGIGCLFISGISGDFYNVVGLPLYKLGMLLREAGFKLI